MTLTEMTVHSNDFDLPAWIQAIVSIFTAFGLIYTLILQKKATDDQTLAMREQTKVNEAQLKIAERDHLRFLNEIRPKLFLTESFNRDTKRGSISILIQMNDALRFTVENRCKDIIEITKGIYLPTSRRVGSINEISYKVTDLEKLENWSENRAPYAFIFYFEDSIGIMYTQTAIKFLNDPDFKITPAQTIKDIPDWLIKRINAATSGM